MKRRHIETLPHDKQATAKMAEPYVPMEGDPDFIPSKPKKVLTKRKGWRILKKAKMQGSLGDKFIHHIRLKLKTLFNKKGIKWQTVTRALNRLRLK